MSKTVIVLGIGRFGHAVATKLFDKGLEVMAVDKDYNRVQKIANHVTSAVQADMSDEEAMKSLGISNFDVAIIATGSSLESSIEATLICKDNGVEQVIAKANGEAHARILEKIGADEIVYPEQDTGDRLARFLAGSNLLEFIHFSNDYSMVEVKAHREWIGKTLKELDFRTRFNMNVVAFERDGEMIISPGPNLLIESKDILILMGPTKYATNLDGMDI